MTAPRKGEQKFKSILAQKEPTTNDNTRRHYLLRVLCAMSGASRACKFVSQACKFVDRACKNDKAKPILRAAIRKERLCALWH